MGWRVTLLGEIRVTYDTRETTRFESSRVVALLARLVLFPERIHPREQLIELLWPDVELEIGRHRLRTTLFALRRQLEPSGSSESLILADRHALRLNPNVCTCDVWELERAIRQKHWQSARALYRGELLPGFYEDWILTERERLEALSESLPEPTTIPISPPLLPTYLTVFFGRESEKAQLTRLLHEQRLVTLTGPGGIGKTRLATETARLLASAFERCAFVSFAECFDSGGLTERLRGALGLQSNTDLRETLSEQKTLLVLDNLEHLLRSRRRSLGSGTSIPSAASKLPGNIAACPGYSWRAGDGALSPTSSHYHRARKPSTGAFLGSCSRYTPRSHSHR
ncbi:MAG: AAA family ATPase [Armatimonas sp.]